jgi:hypothetical protein
MNEFLFLITTYNRFDNLKALIDSILKYNGTKKILIVDDCSTDIRYDILKDYHEDVVYYKTEINNGKVGYWKTVNFLYNKAKEFNFIYGITIPDDVELIENFDLVVRKYVKDDILRNFTQTTAGIKNWGYTYWVDCTFSAKKEVFEKLEFKINPIEINDNYKLSSGVGQQLTERINELKLKVVNYGSIIKHIGNEDSKMHPILRKEQPLFGVDFYGDIVICGLATIESRKNNLKLTVESLIDQVDKLIIYQNGYFEIPDFLKTPKIEVFSSIITGIDMGDAGKFYKINEYKENYYYLTCDDDIIYPNDYVSNIITNLKKHDNKVIVSHHGRIMKKNAKSYYKDFEIAFRCLDEVNVEMEIDFCGTGVMGLHTSLVKGLTFETFKYPNMADIWVGKFAKENDIPMLILKHNSNWIKTSLNKGDRNTIFVKYLDNHSRQNEILQSITFNTLNVKPKVIFVSCTYKRPEITKKIIQIWEKIQENTKNYLEYENIIVDSEYSNLEVFKNNRRFKYFNYENFPISNKWNYAASILKTKVFDYVIFLGSDDFVDEDLMNEYYKKMKSKYDFIGIQDMYVYNLKNNKKYYWRGYKKETGRQGETIGLGRCFSKNLLEKLNYQPWIDGINKSLDSSMQNKLKGISNFTKTTINLKKDGGFACDVKSNLNITNIEMYNDLEDTKNEKFNLFDNSEFKSEINPIYENNLNVIVEPKKQEEVKIEQKIELSKKQLNYEKINSIFQVRSNTIISKPNNQQNTNNLKLNSQTISKVQNNKKRLR